MAYGVLQKNRFSPQYKKLNDNVSRDVNAAVAEVAEQPMIGVRKKGDLANLFVHKFYSQSQLHLLGYTVDDGICLIYLEAASSHENFYRDLKRK